MDIRITSLLRIKPNALYKLGKYLRKNGFHRVALFYGQGMADVVGKNVAISLESSEIEVVGQARGTAAVDQAASGAPPRAPVRRRTRPTDLAHPAPTGA